jgi:hypothetical protein
MGLRGWRRPDSIRLSADGVVRCRPGRALAPVSQPGKARRWPQQDRGVLDHAGVGLQLDAPAGSHSTYPRCGTELGVGR